MADIAEKRSEAKNDWNLNPCGYSSTNSSTKYTIIGS